MYSIWKRNQKRLVYMGQNQNWLIEQVKERTGTYFDSSYLFKIMVGRSATPKVVQAICEILGLPQQESV